MIDRLEREIARRDDVHKKELEEILSLSLTHTHTHSLSLSLSHTHTHTLSVSISLFYAFTLSHTHSLSLSQVIDRLEREIARMDDAHKKELEETSLRLLEQSNDRVRECAPPPKQTIAPGFSEYMAPRYAIPSLR